MKRIYPTIALTLSCVFSLLLSKTYAQTATNFSLGSNLYEFRTTKVDSAHVQFSIAQSTAKSSDNTNKTDSKILLNNISADEFGKQFDLVMRVVDTTYKATPTDSTIKADLASAKTKLFAVLIPPPTKSTLETKVDELNLRFNKVFGAQADIRPVGVFSLVADTCRITDTGRAKPSARIKSVTIRIANGSIAKRGLEVVMADNRRFTNMNAPINLYNFAKLKNLTLKIKDNRSKQTIQVGDVIDYNPLNNRFYYPADQDDIALSPDAKTDTIKLATDINHLLDVSAYTDLFGLLGHKANGILQTEATGNFISNTYSLKNTDIVFNNFFQPYFRWSKFDSKFGQLDSSKIKFGKNGAADTVNRTYLNQISYLQAGLKVNLVRFAIGNNQLVYINGGVDINLSAADSLYNKDISFINYYPEVAYAITWTKNWEFNMYGKMYFQSLTGDAPFANRETNHIISFQAMISYYPFTDPDSRIYMRFNYFNNTDNNKYNYSQFQVGWKTSLFAQNKTIAK